jgi:hypothetical protein
MHLEDDENVNFMEPELRNYTVAVAKSVLNIEEGKSKINKGLPKFFADVYEIERHDLSFLQMPKNPLYLGNLRSGSKEIDAKIQLDGDDVLSHHILVAATTGRGKSNLTSCVLWNLLDYDYAGILVLDPHDEYFGRTKQGMKDHPK